MPPYFQLSDLILAIVLFAVAFVIVHNRHEKRKVRILLTIFSSINIQGVLTMVTLKDSQQVSGILTVQDAKGNAASLQPGTVKITSSDEEVFTVEVDPDHETKFKIIAGKPGVAQLNFSGDADLTDEGVKTIEGFAGVEVTAGDAVGFGASFDQPTEQPAASATSSTDTTATTNDGGGENSGNAGDANNSGGGENAGSNAGDAGANAGNAANAADSANS